MTIETMRPEQIGAVKSLLDSCFGASAWSEESVRSQLEKSDSHSIVAVDDGMIVGYLAFEQIIDEGSVVELAVHPAYRRQGIARKMAASAFNNNSLKEIFLEVRESNFPAIRLYESLGFTQIGVRKDYYSNPKENAVLFRLPLVKGAVTKGD